MTYQVRLAAEARRSLQRLPPKVFAAVVEYMHGPLADNPRRLSKPLVNELRGLRTARRGDYRILLSIDDEAQAILISRIAHRADVYRPQ